MKETEENPFGQWLKKKRKAKGWSVRKLADEASVCHYSLISQIENNTYVGKKGKPMQVDETIVAGLANALGEPVNAALELADYPIKSELKRPTNFAEFAEALESLGIFNLQMFGGEEVFDSFTEDDYELFLEKMRNDVLYEVKRKGMAK